MQLTPERSFKRERAGIALGPTGLQEPVGLRLDRRASTEPVGLRLDRRASTEPPNRSPRPLGAGPPRLPAGRRSPRYAASTQVNDQTAPPLRPGLLVPPRPA